MKATVAIIVAVLAIGLSGCGMTPVESLVFDTVAVAVYDETLGSLPEITPEQVKEAEKVINPDTDGR